MQGDCNGCGALVLAAGYAVHDEPFFAANRDGLTSYLIRLQTEGRAKVLMGESMMDIEPGDLVMYAPNDPYILEIGESGRMGETLCTDGALRDEDLTLGASSPVQGSAPVGPSMNPEVSPSGDYFVFCRGRWVNAWWSGTSRPRCVNIPLSDMTLGLWRQLVWHHNGVGSRKRKISEYLLRALLLHLDDVVETVDSVPTTADSLVAHQMKAFLERHVGEEISIQDVADHVGLSVSRAVHLFKETFNQTMVQFLQEARLGVACDRIRFSRMTLEEAAESAGFRSYSYFYRLFRSHFGMSPKQFRANMK